VLGRDRTGLTPLADGFAADAGEGCGGFGATETGEDVFYAGHSLRYMGKNFPPQLKLLCGGCAAAGEANAAWA
jgi:hypothetical protein